MLTKNELWQLRKEIILDSMYYSDYENTKNIDSSIILDFFDGYTSYLYELMLTDGFADKDFYNYLSSYDNKNNLYDYYTYECSDYFREEI